MLILILLLVVGSILVYISKYNFVPVTVNLGLYTFSDIPLFYVIVASVIFGLVLSYLFYLVHAISNSFTLRGKNKEIKKQVFTTGGADFFDHLLEKSWTYIKTVVDVVREPVLILDKDFRVIVANDPFYNKFKVKSTETENKIVYELGDGQWNIPGLRKLLEDILPKDTFFNGFEVTHDFPSIGRKIMILNARQIHFEENVFFKENALSKLFQKIILLAIEDVTEIMDVAETLASHTKNFEDNLTKRTQEMEICIGKLREEINELKKQHAVTHV